VADEGDGLAVGGDVGIGVGLVGEGVGGQAPAAGAVVTDDEDALAAGAVAAVIHQVVAVGGECRVGLEAGGGEVA
jgi:hypothetical protein